MHRFRSNMVTIVVPDDDGYVTRWQGRGSAERTTVGFVVLANLRVLNSRCNQVDHACIQLWNDSYFVNQWKTMNNPRDKGLTN